MADNTDLLQSLSAKDEVLDEQLTEHTILAIAGRMLEWKAKAGVLGLSAAEREDIQEDNSRNCERKVALMRRWRDKYADLATLRKFLAVAQENGWEEFRGLGGTENSEELEFDKSTELENSEEV